ncbi:hypothetical protein [Rhizobium vallis]|nr:hypothetical protein [Rhizobium vallis]
MSACERPIAEIDDKAKRAAITLTGILRSREGNKPTEQVSATSGLFNLE